MKKIILLPIALLLTVFVFGQNTSFIAKEFVSENDTLRYRISFPENYNKNQKYPLVIFLHGSGERGNDNLKQLANGGKIFENPANRAKFPAIVIFPQCPANQFWAPLTKEDNKRIFPEKSEITEPLALVVRLITSIQKNEKVDSRRIYVMGLSMGGMGTFDIICRYPKLFAAAVPICGGINLKRLNVVKNMPIRIFHGAKDDLVLPDFSRDAYKTLKNLGSKKVEYIEFPDANHNSWDPAFQREDFLDWVFSQKK